MEEGQRRLKRIVRLHRPVVWIAVVPPPTRCWRHLYAGAGGRHKVSWRCVAWAMRTAAVGIESRERVLRVGLKVGRPKDPPLEIAEDGGALARACDTRPLALHKTIQTKQFTQVARGVLSTECAPLLHTSCFHRSVRSCQTRPNFIYWSVRSRQTRPKAR